MTSPMQEQERFERAVAVETKGEHGGPLTEDETWLVRWVIPAITLPYFYAVLPFRLRRRYRVPRDGDIHRVPSDAPDAAPALPPEADAAIAALAREGFATLEHVVERGAFGRPLRVVVLGHPAEPHVGYVTIAGARAQVIAAVALDTEWRDGTRTHTWTGPFSPPGARADVDVVWIRDPRDAVELLAVHRMRCARRARAGAQALTTWRDAPLASYARGRREGIEASVRAGRSEATPDGLEVRPTRRGALLGAWRNLFPTYHVLRWLAWRQGARELRAVREGRRE
ncbi:MAG: hypothetical protein ACJ8AO_19990 [Gemmatimonadaceae bacterium]